MYLREAWAEKYDPALTDRTPLPRPKAMNLNLTEEQLAVRDAARDFAQNVLKPGVIERDNEQRFPADEIRQLGELGFMGMMVDPKYGGSGMDTVSYVLGHGRDQQDRRVRQRVHERQQLFGLCGLQEYGTEAQKEKYLVPLASGEKSGRSASRNRKRI